MRSSGFVQAYGLPNLQTAEAGPTDGPSITPAAPFTRTTHHAEPARDHPGGRHGCAHCRPEPPPVGLRLATAATDLLATQRVASRALHRGADVPRRRGGAESRAD